MHHHWEMKIEQKTFQTPNSPTPTFLHISRLSQTRVLHLIFDPD